MKTKRRKKTVKKITAPEVVVLKYQTVIEATIKVTLPKGATADELLDALQDGDASYYHDAESISWHRDGEYIEVPVPLRDSEIIDEEVTDWEQYG